jgi:hypothetical protein
LNYDEVCAKYFNPNSKEHIKLINKEYDMNNLQFGTKEYMYARFVSSWFNASGKGSYTKNLHKLKLDIKKLLNDFKDTNVSKSGLDLLLEVRNSSDYDSLKDIEKEYFSYRLLMLLEGLSGIQKLIGKANFSNPIKKSSRNFRNFEEYFDEVRKKISLLNSKLIPGMGITLVADAVKESGLIDVIKTDLHVVRVLNGVFNLKLKENPDSDGQFKETLREMYKVYMDTDEPEMSMYKLDKLIYLSCSAFYLDDEKPNRDSAKREELIKYILN